MGEEEEEEAAGEASEERGRQRQRSSGGAMVPGGPHANGRAASPPSPLAVSNGESNIAVVKRASALAVGTMRGKTGRCGAARVGGGRHASGDGAGCS